MSARELFLRRRVIVCAGSGGAGKTTIAAALGVLGARLGLRVAVVTIDPARRLKDALGLDHLASTPHRIALDAKGSMHAMMLEQKPAWDRMIAERSPSTQLAERILSNRFYRRFSAGFAGAHAYAAIDTLCELSENQNFDAIIVDTPPMLHAIELFRSPEKVIALVEDSALPKALRLFREKPEAQTRGARWLLRRLEGAVGGAVLGDALELLSSLAEMFDVFAARATAMQEMLRGDTLACVLIATPDERSIGDARRFLEETEALGVRTDSLVLNRSAAAALAGDEGLDARSLRRELEAQLEPRALEFVLANLTRYRSRAELERRRVGALLESRPHLERWFLAELDRDIHELDTLGVLARRLE